MADQKPLELSQGQEAYRRILDEIRAGHLLPGDRLMEVELANRLGFSRTPVREAIRQLEGDGVVAHVPRVGAAIRRLDHAEISELYDMRAVLESTAARFAARAASEVELAELASIQQAMAAGDGDVYVLNRQFHAALLDAARNRFLKKAVASIHTTLLILGPSTLREDERAEDALKEHAAILGALMGRDEDGAERAMRAHIAAAHGARLKQMRPKI